MGLHSAAFPARPRSDCPSCSFRPHWQAAPCFSSMPRSVSAPAFAHPLRPPHRGRARSAPARSGRCRSGCCPHWQIRSPRRFRRSWQGRPVRRLSYPAALWQLCCRPSGQPIRRCRRPSSAALPPPGPSGACFSAWADPKCRFGQTAKPAHLLPHCR